MEGGGKVMREEPEKVDKKSCHMARSRRPAWDRRAQRRPSALARSLLRSDMNAPRCRVAWDAWVSRPSSERRLLVGMRVAVQRAARRRCILQSLSGGREKRLVRVFHRKPINFLSWAGAVSTLGERGRPPAGKRVRMAVCMAGAQEEGTAARESSTKRQGRKPVEASMASMMGRAAEYRWCAAGRRPNGSVRW